MSGSGKPPVDVESFRAIMREGGIEEIVELTLKLYERETPTVFQRIRDAVSEQDSREICAGAHLLKSSSANIRAEVLSGCSVASKYRGVPVTWTRSRS